MDEIMKGQVTANAAEVYEAFYLPALFQEWATRMVEAARIMPGEHVLDVACGTGVAARTAAERVGPDGSVVGLDINDGMLAVAERVAPEIDWRRGVAEALPFDDDRFDAVLCQFGLMFFEDGPTSIREMMRVLRPGGRLAVAVWDALERSSGYLAFVGLLERLFGAETAGALRAPFVLGDPRALGALFAGAGYPEAVVETQEGTARFPSIESWVYADVKGWTAAERIDDAGHERLLREAARELGPFEGADGTVAFRMPAHLVTVVKAG